MHFEIIGDIQEAGTIAIGGGIRDIMRLRRQSGAGRWRRLNGVAQVRLASGSVRLAEAHGVGRRKLKIKRFPD